MEIESFLKSMKNELRNRVKGTAVFLTPNPDGVPHSLLHNLKHNKVIHKTVILLISFIIVISLHSQLTSILFYGKKGSYHALPLWLKRIIKK